MPEETFLYPIIGIAPPTESGGVVAGTGADGSEETKKRIWKLAEERRIEDTSANRKLAFSIDGLARFIVNIKRFSILQNYTLTSSDDKKNEGLLKEIKTFLSSIKLLHIFRQVFTPLQLEGEGYIQKQYEGNTVTSLSVLEQLVKHTNPTDAADFYFYQNQKVSKNWQDPEEEDTQTLKTWFIDMDKLSEYTTIEHEEDNVLPKTRIIEILNNESGESNMQAVVSYIFIKNFLLQMLPNLIEVVTNPQEEIIYDTIDKAGRPCIPKLPTEALKTADPSKYKERLKIYTTWKNGLGEMVNRIAVDRTKTRKSVHPDTVHENIIESNSSVNSNIIEALVKVLDTQIAYGMGFSLSLITASGVEVATAHNIFSVVATTMRGVQQQFEDVAKEIICERFPGAEAENVEFTLDELNPEDELAAAQRKKFHAESAEILSNIGYNEEEITTFVSRNVDENLKGLDARQDTDEAAEEVVSAMLDFRNLAENGELGE
jgi:metal-sulfur cluster biosynthetic enzyme